MLYLAATRTVHVALRSLSADDARFCGNQTVASQVTELEIPVGGLSVRRAFLKYFGPTQLRSFSSFSHNQRMYLTHGPAAVVIFGLLVLSLGIILLKRE